jgi:phthiodiolone/phenolphthiodiolone dimycocerosates ketoreductase
MLRAVGRYGDAWFPGFPQRHQYYAQRLEVIRAAASDTGRDPMSIAPAPQLMVITGRGRGTVDAALDSNAAKVVALNASAESFERHGVQHPLGAPFAGAPDLLPFTMDEQTALSHAAKVPPSLVREIVLNGTPSGVLEKAAEWRDHGVRYMVVAKPQLYTASSAQRPGDDYPVRSNCARS